ncbi:hypothetical protein BDN72DRAFT_859679 [Pluteus cervinus]|uniref:Uncharacterized protein n=1 Tax=Pluteus cervinus TaxID=181527 RepID=A0ACD3AN66_9AGAR|nr:hypothetical protein BDN72DRAFT_859679 [Pluteus cervinus]
MHHHSSRTLRSHRSRLQPPSIALATRGEGSSATPRRRLRGDSSPQPRSLPDRLASRDSKSLAPPIGFGLPSPPSNQGKGSTSPFSLGNSDNDNDNNNNNNGHSGTTGNSISSFGNSGSSNGNGNGNSGNSGSNNSGNSGSNNSGNSGSNSGSGSSGSNSGSSNSNSNIQNTGSTSSNNGGGNTNNGNSNSNGSGSQNSGSNNGAASNSVAAASTSGSVSVSTKNASGTPVLPTTSQSSPSHGTSSRPSPVGGGESGNGDGGSSPPDSGNLSSHGPSKGLIAGLSVLFILIFAALLLFWIRRRSMQRRSQRSRNWWFGRSSNRESVESYHSETYTQTSVMDLTPSGITSDPTGAHSERSSYLSNTAMAVSQLAVPPMAEIRDEARISHLFAGTALASSSGYANPRSRGTAEIRDEAGISHLFSGAALASSTGHAYGHSRSLETTTDSPQKTIGTRASANMTDPDPHSQYLYVHRPVSQVSGGSSLPSPMSVRPFSPTESFAFPKPPSRSSNSGESDGDRSSWSPVIRSKGRVFVGSPHISQGSRSILNSAKGAVHGFVPPNKAASTSSSPALDINMPSPVDFSSSLAFRGSGVDGFVNRAEYRTSQIDPFADPRMDEDDQAYGAIYLEGFETGDAIPPSSSVITQNAPAVPPKIVSKRSTITATIRGLFIPPSPSIPPPSAPMPYTPTVEASTPSSHAPVPPPALPINTYAPVEVVVKAHLPSHPGFNPYPTVEYGVNGRYEELDVSPGEYVRVVRVLNREWVVIETLREGTTSERIVKEGVVPADCLRKLEAIPVPLTPPVIAAEPQAPSDVGAQTLSVLEDHRLSVLVREGGKWVVRP